MGTLFIVGGILLGLTAIILFMGVLTEWDWILMGQVGLITLGAFAIAIAISGFITYGIYLNSQ